MKQSNVVAVYDTDFETPLLFLLLNTDRETEFIIGSEFYMELILKSLGVDEPYVLDWVLESEPVSLNLTEAGVKEFYPESKEFCQIEVLNLTLENLMDLENY